MCRGFTVVVLGGAGAARGVDAGLDGREQDGSAPKRAGLEEEGAVVSCCVVMNRARSDLDDPGLSIHPYTYTTPPTHPMRARFSLGSSATAALPSGAKKGRKPSTTSCRRATLSASLARSLSMREKTYLFVCVYIRFMFRGG